jgi:hypothetical protein
MLSVLSTVMTVLHVALLVVLAVVTMIIVPQVTAANFDTTRVRRHVQLMLGCCLGLIIHQVVSVVLHALFF